MRREMQVVETSAFLWFSIVVRIFMTVALSISVILVGFNFSSFAMASRETLKIQIVHSHEHDHEHHHHHDTSAADSSRAQNAESESSKSSQSVPSNQHSHELLVSFGHTIFIEPKTAFSIASEIIASHPDPQDIRPPRNRSLGSIFRPPITA